MKLVRCNGQPVARPSDTPGKTTCDAAGYLAHLQHVFEVSEPSAVGVCGVSGGG